ncbi:hypothetical protein GCM10007424_06470 [Flavobacterium suaedae]|uniref:Outer membrane protein beta-barrel domain-containing protein n=1 Tax=Flavobacterium suaedae TaxID=1767027 RepID=A0ABQ1JL41_9FLAO|nr:hypothetical protein [Flavobacterium suaedae]GGB69206.1 hypothetical protein GCM10007424_06470 [Flavobacterium suaedae]
MKKILLAAICFVGVQSLTAQETNSSTTTTTSSVTINETTVDDNYPFKFYFGFGISVPGDYKINDNLGAAGMPQLKDAMPEFIIGYNIGGKKVSVDIELAASYLDKKTSSDRIKYTGANIVVRPHYVILNSEKFTFSGGLDLSYQMNRFDLYERGNVIDLNNLNPGTHTGHINLYNKQLNVGPSLTFIAFKNYDIPVKLTTGYQWSVLSSKWESEVANVANSLREDGQGRFYARLSFYLN